MAIPWKKVSLGTLLVLLVLAGAAYAYWTHRIGPYYWVSKTRHGNMARLQEAVVRFSTDKGRLPSSLEEMVRLGFLPPESTLYFSPMKHHTIGGYAIPYQAVEFELSFASSQVTIAIPAEVFSEKTYAFAKPEWRVWTVGSDVIAVDPKELKDAKLPAAR